MNVIFIAVDDLNDWVGVFGGNPQAQTPNIDKFANQGALVFEKAFSPATVCGPSRSALLTGKYSHTTGVYGNDTNLRHAPITKNLDTIPQWFSRHGYYSLSAGKIFHKHQDKTSDKGDEGQWAFDEWVNPSAKEHKGKWGRNKFSFKEGTKVHIKPAPGEKAVAYSAKALQWGELAAKPEETKDYITSQWAVDQLSRNFDDKPFFMAVGISKPHLPWYVPSQFYDQFPLDEIVLPKVKEGDLDDIVDSKGKVAAKKHVWWKWLEREGKHKEAVRAYLASVAYVDHCLGSIFKGLNESKYADNTIVVIWGDHGWHLGEKFKYGKATPWMESCRVPLLIRMPGVTDQGVGKSKGLVNLIDLYPTLSDLCGLPINPENEGRSFKELIYNPKMEWNYPTVVTDVKDQSTVFDQQYQYIRSTKFNKKVLQLYDYVKDPLEWNNLANNPEYKGVIEKLDQHLPSKYEAMSIHNKNVKH
ncbi:MAG: sulfatase [Planctomycetes bacterium]|nr:sulfatase [Planctomycetota bacterium]